MTEEKPTSKVISLTADPEWIRRTVDARVETKLTHADWMQQAVSECKKEFGRGLRPEEIEQLEEGYRDRQPVEMAVEELCYPPTDDDP